MVRTLLLASLVLAACKGDPVKCESACRNYGTLTYWAGIDPLIAAAPPEQRETMRREKLADFEQRLESGVDTCVTQCVSANNEETIDCMIGAKTGTAARACVADQ
jgi:hypothetical protein